MFEYASQLAQSVVVKQNNHRNCPKCQQRRRAMRQQMKAWNARYVSMTAYQARQTQRIKDLEVYMDRVSYRSVCKCFICRLRRAYLRRAGFLYPGQYYWNTYLGQKTLVSQWELKGVDLTKKLPNYLKPYRRLPFWKQLQYILYPYWR